MFKKLWSYLASKVGDTWYSKNILAIWPYPAILIGSPHSKFTWTDYRNFTNIIKPGDFILTRSAPFFGSNAAIPGAFKHLAVYIGNVRGIQDKETSFIEITNKKSDFMFDRTIVHAISEGVVCQDFGQILFHSDYVIIIRPWRNAFEQSVIVTKAKSVLGKKYDFLFDMKDDKELFCTELGILCLKAVGIELPLTIKKNVLGKEQDVSIADSFGIYNKLICSNSCYDSNFVDECCNFPLRIWLTNRELQ